MASHKSESDTKGAVYKGTNEVPRTGDGKVLHVDVGPGEVANRVVTVGTASRAAVLACHLDGAEGRDPKGRGVPGIFFHESGRGFTVYTGKVGGVPVSIVAIGMGMAMMDFLVRELRAVVEGPMLFVRFGTCGGMRAEVPEGSVVVSSLGALSVTRLPDAFEETEKPGAPAGASYHISKVVLPDAALSAAILAALIDALPETGAVAGLNATADSFYSSQGRVDPNFDDRSAGLLELLCKRHPEAASMEMESFALLDLARSSKGTIKATATAIVVANRPTGKVVDGPTLGHVESAGGKAVMQALAAHPID